MKKYDIIHLKNANCYKYFEEGLEYMEKKQIETIAAIDVGSNYLRMIIAEVKSNGEINQLEDLRKNTNIGKDTFAYGRIGVDSINKTCDTLKDFALLMKDYHVKHYRAVSTSGVREAENRDYIVDQIRIKTGINVEIINNAQERFLMYKGLRESLHGIQRMTEEGALLVNVSSGGMEISVYSQGKLVFSDYIKTGSLRIREILSDLERITTDFPKIMEEYIGSKTYSLESYIKAMNIKNFIGLGGELSSIASLNIRSKSFQQERFIGRTTLEKLYLKVCAMNTEQIISEYEITQKQAEGLLPSVIIFNRLLKTTKADGMYVPSVSLRHGLLADMVDELFNTKRKNEAINDIVSSVWYIGEKFGIDKIHSENVKNIALSIFEQTSKIHKLKEKEELYLTVASILHDVGKYVDLNEHDIHSYNIISSQNILGLSNDELKLVANIARYHLDSIPDFSHNNYRVLSEKDRITVSKLSAILKLAESLDISHKQKIRKVDISINGKELVLKVKTDQDILLEKWNFKDNVNFFEEVMGIKPIIKQMR